MQLEIDQDIRLELLHQEHAQEIFTIADKNRVQFRQWLPWVNAMNDIAFIENFIADSQKRNQDKIEYAFVIIAAERIVGRIGVQRINYQNKIGEIGYWMDGSYQGKGLMTKACHRLLDFCFYELNLNRIEIKCGTENTKSLAIPERLGFLQEGILRQAEWVNGKFIDLFLFSLCKSDERK